MISTLEKIDLTHAILNHSSTLVVITNRQGEIQVFNKACTRLTGFSYEEVKGSTIANRFLLGEEIAEFYNIFNRLIAGFQIHEFECHWKTKLEAPRLIHWTTNVQLDYQDRVEYVIFFGMDVTEYRLNNARYASIFKNLGVGILNINVNGVVTDINAEFTRITGLPADEVVGQYVTDLAKQYSSPKDIDHVLNIISQLLVKKKIANIEFEFRGKTLSVESIRESYEGGLTAILRDVSK